MGFAEHNLDTRQQKIFQNIKETVQNAIPINCLQIASSLIPAMKTCKPGAQC